jgi:hypothetical protein
VANFTLDVTRADDLLVLRFEFVNLVLDPNENVLPRRLIRASAASEALMIVHFQPQHISEQCFSVNTTGDDGRIKSVIAGNSRLAFRLRPDMQSLPLKLDDLLNWDSFEQVLTLEEVPQNESRGISKPLDHETAIELPFRITLSPDRASRWIHRAQPFAARGGVELWHTQLAATAAARLRGATQLWAIWSPDHPEFHPQPDDFSMSLTFKDRSEIVQISSDFTLLDADRFRIDPQGNPDEFGRLQELASQRSQRLAGERLMLSALGGWVNLHSRFNFPSLPGFLQQMKGHEFDQGDDLFALIDWSHIANMGRDQYVRTVKRGFLFPFGHRANVITITERKFKPARAPATERPAYLFQRSMLVIQEPVREYDPQERGMPFVSVTMTNLATPEFDPLAQNANIPRVNGVSFPFAMRAIDREGRKLDFAAPVVFVPANEVGNLTAVARTYESLGGIDFRSQLVAFAETNPHNPADSAVKTATIQFAHNVQGANPPFVPRMVTAEVHLPAAEQLLGTASRTAIRYHKDYISSGLAGIGGGVFAEIVDGLLLGFPPDKVGGMAAPTVKLTGLSNEHGAIPNVDAVASGNFSGGQLVEGLEGKLLGVIDLKTIIAAATTSGELPKLKTVSEPGGQRTTFQWTPKLKDPLPSPLKAEGGTPTLVISGTRFQPSGAGGQAFTSIEGTLSNFALSFAGVVRVGFGQLFFHMETGKKPSFDATVKAVDFEGDLAFVKKIADELQKHGFGAKTGPAITITPEGITAGAALGVPDIKLGAFGLQNIILSTAISLFFFGKPAEVRFALSSRENPFLVSYAPFGGGGFFALTASTASGGVQLEMALEFGGVFAIDLIIAKGEVQLMAGIIFELKEGKAALGGSVRIYGYVEVLRIVAISVLFYLSLKYVDGKATGRAALTVMVRVFAFSQSVTLTVEQSFSTITVTSSPVLSAPVGTTVPGIDDTRTFDQAMALPEWRQYCGAFA